LIYPKKVGKFNFLEESLRDDNEVHHRGLILPITSFVYASRLTSGLLPWSEVNFGGMRYERPDDISADWVKIVEISRHVSELRGGLARLVLIVSLNFVNPQFICCPALLMHPSNNSDPRILPDLAAVP
jgi:hypothetical protein